ncbi:MAG: hypothetical protein L0H31_14955 [Nocardioidaceae bacterium]|nr:hypothetical protein [Nocardioidaceae bacterium]
MTTTTVPSVRGPIDLDALGPTLMHEHVFVLTPEVLSNYGEDWWDEEERVTDAITKLRTLKASGIDTIVDPTVIGLGRFIPRIQRVNEQVDINIVVATGLYTFDEIPHYFHYRGPGALFDGPEPMTELFLKDLTEGIGTTGVRAAFLKGVVEERGLTPDQTRVHAALCEAHVQTGAPITVHTNAAEQTGLLAIDFYRRHGVDLTKVVIGHAGDSNDMDYLRKIVDAGAVVGCDRFGLDVFNPTDARVETVVRLCEQGYADQIVLAHDASCYMDFFSGHETQEQLHAAVPNWNYQHIPEDVLPMLRARGVSEEQITTMLVDNPRRYFSPAS